MGEAALAGGIVLHQAISAATSLSIYGSTQKQQAKERAIGGKRQQAEYQLILGSSTLDAINATRTRSSALSSMLSRSIATKERQMLELSDRDLLLQIRGLACPHIDGYRKSYWHPVALTFPQQTNQYCSLSSVSTSNVRRERRSPNDRSVASREYALKIARVRLSSDTGYVS